MGVGGWLGYEKFFKIRKVNVIGCGNFCNLCCEVDFDVYEWICISKFIYFIVRGVELWGSGWVVFFNVDLF